MSDPGDGIFILLFLIFFVGAVVLSITVSKNKVWVPVIFCIMAGFSIGLAFTGGDVRSVFIGGLIFGPILALITLSGGQQTKRYRENGLKKLKQMERDLTMDDLFKNGK